MSNLSKKLLAEAFDAYVNEGDVAKATRLFQHHWNSKAKECFSLLEAEDEDFEVTDMGDDFNQEIADEAGSDKEQKFEQLQISVDELEDKYPSEMTDEVQAKFDELRNKIDELKLADEGDEVSSEDAEVALEDLKADFEMAGDVAEDVEALFNEISAGIQGGEAEEVDAADEEEGDVVDADAEEEPVEEAADEEPKAEEELDVDFSEEGEEPAGEDVEAPKAEGEDESEDLDIIYDAKESAEELLAKLDELEANEKAEEGEDVEAPAEDEEEGLKEGWEKSKLPRNKLQNEEEGVKKDGMKFGKPGAISTRKGMGVSHSVSAGQSADKKPKVDGYENKGVKSWSKVAKPANEAKDAKSVLGN